MSKPFECLQRNGAVPASEVFVISDLLPASHQSSAQGESNVKTKIQGDCLEVGWPRECSADAPVPQQVQQICPKQGLCDRRSPPAVILLTEVMAM